MNKYIRAIISNYLFFFASTVLFLVITPVAVHNMGDVLFGMWSILLAILGFSSIGDLGLGVVVNKFASEYLEDPKEICTIISTGILILLPMALISFLILIIARNFLIPTLDIPEEFLSDFEKAWVIIGLCLFPQFLSRIVHGYLYSQLKNTMLRAVEFGVQLATWIGVIWITAQRRDILTAAYWLLFVQISSMCFLYYLIFRSADFRFTFKPSMVKKMTMFSFFTFLESVAVTMYQKLDRVVVGAILGPVAAGVYSVGTSVGLRISIVTGQVTGVMVPYASLKSSKRDNTNLEEIFNNMSRIVNLMLVVMGGLLAVWMEEILYIWFSPEYASNNHLIFSLLIVAYTILSQSRIGHQTLTGMGEVSFSSGIYLLMSSVMIAGIYLLSKKFGLLGAAAAQLSTILLLAYNLRVYYKLRGYVPFGMFVLENIWPLLSAATGFLLVLFGLPILSKLIFSLGIVLISTTLLLRDEFFMSQVKSALGNLSLKND